VGTRTLCKREVRVVRSEKGRCISGWICFEAVNSVCCWCVGLRHKITLALYIKQYLSAAFVPFRLLSLALGLYRKALDAASDAVDCATAHKNIAATLGHLSTKANKHGPSSSSLQSSAALSQTAGLLLEAVEHR